jgi:hypothetical protein
MKKLSKEQAQRLIEKFDQDFKQNDYWQCSLPSQKKEFIRKVINQCAEKEFLGFKIKTLDAHDDDMIEVTKDMGGDGISDKNIFIQIENGGWDNKAFAMLNHEEFRLFAEKCNKIVEWLNDQENEKP